MPDVSKTIICSLPFGDAAKKLECLSMARNEQASLFLRSVIDEQKKIMISTSGTNVIKLFCPQFMNVRDKPECLSLSGAPRKG